MRYWAAVILVGFIVGAAGHSSQDSLLQDAGTLAWMVGVVMVVRLAWQHWRGRRHAHH